MTKRLIIEDDSFAEVLLQVARDNGFKAIVAYQGETGYKYAKNTAESDYFRYEITGN
jgi:PII-like signaling protein